MLVYLVTNRIDGKQYLGQTTKTLENRWYSHIQPRKNPSCKYLYSAIQKHGADNFDVKTLVVVGTKWEMDLYESGMIKALNTKAPNGYNLTDGGDGAQGFVFTEEQKRKISLGQIGRKMSEKAREKLLERNKGNKFSLGVKMPEKHRIKLIKINRSRKHSPEELEKMSISHMGKKQSEAHKEAIRKGRHRHYHVNRNIINPKCLLCREGSNSNVIPQ